MYIFTDVAICRLSINAFSISNNQCRVWEGKNGGWSNGNSGNGEGDAAGTQLFLKVHLSLLEAVHVCHFCYIAVRSKVTINHVNLVEWLNENCQQ